MVKPKLNLDSKSCDTLIFGKPLDWSGCKGFKKRTNFDQLRVEQLEQLIAKTFRDGNDPENSWIAPQYLVVYTRLPKRGLASQLPTVTGLTYFFEGYAAHPCGSYLWRSSAFILRAMLPGRCGGSSVSDLNPLRRSNGRVSDCGQPGVGECG